MGKRKGSGSRARGDGDRAPMRTAVHAALCARFDPRPARRVTLVANPLLAREPARRRRFIEVAFAARHLSRAGVTRDVDRVAGFLAVRASRPGAGQLTVLVTMLDTGLHHFDALAVATLADVVQEGLRRATIHEPERDGQGPFTKFSPQRDLPSHARRAHASPYPSREALRGTRRRLTIDGHLAKEPDS